MDIPGELTLEDQHRIILEIMKDIDRFCRANDIRYTISAGTLLGAVRHGGFIPWDDDADIFMLREDFDRFVSIYQSPRYRLLFNTRTDQEHFVGGYAKVHDPGTQIIETKSKANHGLFVDIFPMDNVPDDPGERRRYMHKVMRLNNRLYHRQRTDLVSIIKSYRHSLEWWMDRLDKAIYNPDYAGSRLVAQMIGTPNYRTVFDRSWFDSLSDISFEGYDFRAFSDTDAYLTMLYGPDYMTPRVWSHGLKAYTK